MEKKLNIFIEDENTSVNIINDPQQANILLAADGQVYTLKQQDSEKVEITEEMENKIDYLIQRFGFNKNTEEYYLIKDAIILNLKQNLTSEMILQVLSEKYLTNVKEIKETIDKAIEEAWNNGNKHFHFRLFDKVPKINELIEKLHEEVNTTIPTYDSSILNKQTWE